MLCLWLSIGHRTSVRCSGSQVFSLHVRTALWAFCFFEKKTRNYENAIECFEQTNGQPGLAMELAFESTESTNNKLA